jgi:hypothetical protein
MAYNKKDYDEAKRNYIANYGQLPPLASGVRCCRCKSPVFQSATPGYTFQCLVCDEDLYGIEVEADED